MERILIVDDGRESREFIADYILKPNGFDFIMARDGREGFELAQKQKPDLILLDLQMPRMNGIEMLQAMADAGLDIPVVLMTFYGSEEIAVEVYRLGVKDYVKKPFSIEEMLLAIQRSLGDVRLRREKEALTERLIEKNRQLQRSFAELNILYSIGKSVTSTTDMDQLLPRIVEAAIKVAEAEEGALYLVEGPALICRAQRRRGGRAEAPPQAAATSFAARVASDRKPLSLAAPDHAGSLAAAPLIIHETVIGVLEVGNHTKGAATFGEHECALLSTLSDYAAIAIENSRNYEALRLTKEREKTQIVTSFGRFVPPAVVEQVVARPDSARPGGDTRQVTILFCDMRGYTRYSEVMAAPALLDMLNAYLSPAGDVMLAHGGTIDKYMGDGFMALFNAPSALNDHVMAAARAGVMLQQVIRKLGEQRGEDVAFGVGISTGEAIVGYVGGENTVNFTAIGDAVNVARRLTEAARAGQVLIDEAVMQALSGAGTTKALGELKIRGRNQPARVFELEDIPFE